MADDGRPGFRDWVDRHATPPDWKLLPLTHITRGLRAGDIIRSGQIDPDYCDTLEATYAFFFYGRPAYRVGAEKVVKLEAYCPHCFIFRPGMISRSNDVFAFDTGAFGARLYKHVLSEEFQVRDFRLERELARPNKLISATFGSLEHYFEGDRTRIADPATAAKAHEMEARAYLELLRSPGRNEPDDRICSIEVVFADPVTLSGELQAIVVPHTLWRTRSPSPLLCDLYDNGVSIIPYDFIPNRHPEHYHTLLESAVRQYLRDEGYLNELY